MRIRRRTVLILATAVAAMLLALVPAAGADEQYEFESPVYDIAAAPDGSILVGENGGEAFTVKEIRKGEIGLVAEIDAETPIQGLSAIGRANFFLTTSGTDLAQNGELWRVSRGVAREVADLAAFERNNDPDAFEGPMWKDQRCEFIDGFSTGPQNNPFHVTTLSGSTVLVADAAGNTLLSAKTNGAIDWVAVFTPPTDGNGEWLIRFHQDMVDEDTPIVGEPIPCYVQPVPTSVAIGPDGDLYVGELMGTLAFQEEEGLSSLLPIGLSRVWKIDAGASHVVCSERPEHATGGCELFADGFTSIIDLEFGPDGKLYVVEYDEASWLAPFLSIAAEGGTIHACDLGANCEVVASELEFPSAITFDKRGNLWLLENNDTRAIMGNPPTVRVLDLP
ncbi:MAG TPA: ScyD/ScyE family protein [Acidimicrobiia bacterium]|nr:ScyD/ScyE family protein [Acidimicrobiia bacterium]